MWIAPKKYDAPVQVSTKATIGMDSFYDVNQSAKINAPKYPTLIADRVNEKMAQTGKKLPNATMADSHAEIGVIQKTYEAGKTKNASMSMILEGKDICGYCKGDIAAAAQIAGLKDLTIKAIDKNRGVIKNYYWKQGMKSIKEIK